MEDGKYAVYNNNTYEASLDGETKKIILYTKSANQSNFTKSKIKGCFSLEVDKKDITEAYELKTYAFLANDRVEIIENKIDSILISTFDPLIAKRHNIPRVGYSEYRKHIREYSIKQIKSKIWI